MSIKNIIGLSSFAIENGRVNENSELWEAPVTVLVLRMSIRDRDNATTSDVITLEGRFGNGLNGPGYGLSADVVRKKKTERWTIPPARLGEVEAEFFEGKIVCQATCLADEKDIAIAAMKTALREQVELIVNSARKMQECGLDYLDSAFADEAASLSPRP